MKYDVARVWDPWSASGGIEEVVLRGAGLEEASRAILDIEADRPDLESLVRDKCSHTASGWAYHFNSYTYTLEPTQPDENTQG